MQPDPKRASRARRGAGATLLSGALAVLAACGGPAGSAAGAAPDAGGAAPSGGRVLFHGGVFHDVSPGADPRAPRPTALLAEGGDVVALGSLESLERRFDLAGARRVDLRGGHAFAGLQDAHGHTQGLGALLEDVDLVGCASYSDLVERVAERAGSVPPGTWIRGRGWDQTRWAGGEFPHHAELSARVPDHPVLLSRVDGHAALANAKALAIAGLLEARELPRPAGGAVLADAAGRPTGVLIDTAMGLVARHIPPDDADAFERRVLAAEAELVAVGLTCVHDMGLSASDARRLREMADDGRLSLRIVGYLAGNDLSGPAALSSFPLPYDERDVFGLVGCKFMADGALGSRGAALLEPYADAPDSTGLMRFDRTRFEALVRLAAERGLQPATHAIGDAANRLVLDVYERVARDVPGFAASRPRIEHAQVVAAADRPRFAAIGVVPSMQPTHCTSDMRWVEARVGPERADGSYAWRSLSEGAPWPLAFGSDFPVERPHPLEGLYAALTRQDAERRPSGGFRPRERVTAREALAAFTHGAAVAAHQETRRGRLAPGFGCDLTVVDVDLEALDASNADLALRARVLLTVVNGEVLYSAL